MVDDTPSPDELLEQLDEILEALQEHLMVDDTPSPDELLEQLDEILEALQEHLSRSEFHRQQAKRLGKMVEDLATGPLSGLFEAEAVAITAWVGGKQP